MNAGTYRIYLQNESEPGNEQTGVVVTAGNETPNVDFTLNTAYGTISGNVSGEITGKAPEPLYSMYIQARQKEAGSYSEYVYTSINGDYIIPRLPVNSPNGFAVWCYGQEYVQQYWQNKILYDEATPVFLDESNNKAIDINFNMLKGTTFKGRITSATGTGLSQGQVRVYHQYNNNSYSYTDNLNTTGWYEINSLPGGDYKIRFTADDYITEYYDEKNSQDAADIVSVVTGTTTIINEELEYGARFTGTVTSSTGQIVNNGTIYAYPHPSGSQRSTGLDSNGNYSITGLSAGNYKLRAYTNDYLEEYYYNAENLDDAEIVNLSAGENKKIDFEVELGGMISGNVKDSTGNPITSGYIYADPEASGSTRNSNLDTNGNYLIKGLKGGDYKVNTNISGYPTEYWDDKVSSAEADIVAVVTGEVTGNIDFVLNEGGSVSGTVKDSSGNPYTSGTVYLSAANNPGVNIYSDGLDSSGAFEINYVKAGDYYSYLYLSGKPRIFYPYAYTLDDATQINVADGGNYNGIDFTVPINIPKVNVTGYVYRDGAGYYARVYYKGVDGFSDSSSSWTNSDTGAFSITNLYAGTYIFYTDINNRPHYYYDGKDSEETATRVVLNPGDSRDDIIINIPVEDPIYSTVSGHVYDNSSNPIGNAEVRLQGIESYYMKSAPDGEYYFSQVLAGENYTLRAEKPGYYENEIPGIDVPDGIHLSGQDITLTKIENPGALAGRVYNASGYPLYDVYTIINGIDNDFSESQYTDKYGYYYQDNLEPGTYNIQFSPSGYISKTLNDITVLPNQTVINDASLDFQFGGTGVITGTVRDASGNPAYNIYVRAQNGTGRNVYTDINGVYFMSGMNPDTDYRIYLNSEYNIPEVTDVVVVADQFTEGIDLNLSVNYAYVTGHVTDVTGDPIYNAQINSYSVPGGSYPDSAYTAWTGDYILSRIRTDIFNNYDYNYVFYAQKSPYRMMYYNGAFISDNADQVEFTWGQPSQGGIDFALPEGGAMSGMVENSEGTPLYDCSVYVSRQGGNFSGTYNTDQGGKFLIEGMPPGSYKVRARTNGYVAEYYDDKIYNASADLITVVTGEITQDINFSLETGGAISGRVTNTAGEPISSVYVYADNPQTTDCYGDDRTNANGEYIITGLYTDMYRVRAQFTGYTTVYQYDVSVINNSTTENIDFMLYRTDEYTPTITPTFTQTPTITPGGPTLTPTITPGGPTLTPTSSFTPTITPGGPTLTPTRTPSVTPTSRPGDFNGDGFINREDMEDLIEGVINGDTGTDLTGDGKVDFQDIFEFTKYWNN